MSSQVYFLPWNVITAMKISIFLLFSMTLIGPNHSENSPESNSNAWRRLYILLNKNFDGDLQTLKKLTKNVIENSNGHPNTSTIHCQELGVTFKKEAPFNYLGNPKNCNVSADPHMILYISHKFRCKLDPYYLPNNATETCLRSLNNRTNLTKLVILVPGFLTNIHTEWLHTFKNKIFQHDPTAAVMLVGWNSPLKKLSDYKAAAANTRYIGYTIYKMIKELQRIVPRDLYLHCIGHSLGAHGCGFAGRQILNDTTMPHKLDRISGMDPAGPLFANDTTGAARTPVNLNARLSPSDAKIVDVIHTDGRGYKDELVFQFGTMERLGTVDFYPGRSSHYGTEQPNCTEYILTGSHPCSHSRSWQYFMDTLDKTVDCEATEYCTGDPQNIPQNCKELNNSSTITKMGYWYNPDQVERGMFLVKLNPTTPFLQ